MAAGHSTYLPLRKSLFWDLAFDKIDPVKNKRLIIERTSTRGNLEELSFVINYYGKEQFIQTLLGIHSLDKKSVNFFSKIFNIDPKKFACYKNKPSKKKPFPS